MSHRLLPPFLSASEQRSPASFQTPFSRRSCSFLPRLRCIPTALQKVANFLRCFFFHCDFSLKRVSLKREVVSLPCSKSDNFTWSVCYLLWRLRGLVRFWRSSSLGVLLLPLRSSPLSLSSFLSRLLSLTTFLFCYFLCFCVPCNRIYRFKR